MYVDADNSIRNHSILGKVGDKAEGPYGWLCEPVAYTYTLNSFCLEKLCAGWEYYIYLHKYV